MKTILVQFAETKWTTAAVEAAVEMAQAEHARIVLVRALADSFLDWRGLEASEYEFSEDELADQRQYEMMAATHGVPVETIVIKVHDLAEALAKTADDYQADVVIAPVIHNAIPFSTERDLRHLDHVLEAHHHHLFTVEQPAASTHDYHPVAHAVHA